MNVVQTEEKAFPDIRVEFEVIGDDGQPILDAVRDDFRVEEYDSPVKITEFHSPISKEFRPTTVVLVLDRSGSMNKDNRMEGLKRAVDAFLKKLPEGSRIAVIAFGDRVELICPFTDDPRDVRRAVGDLTPGGYTRFYEAVAEAIHLLSGEEGRRAVLAMTDGEDNLSRTANIQTVVADARKAGFPVHTLGLGPAEEVESANLREVAERTRGKSFAAQESNGLRTIFEEIARGSARRTVSLTRPITSFRMGRSARSRCSTPRAPRRASAACTSPGWSSRRPAGRGCSWC